MKVKQSIDTLCSTTKENRFESIVLGAGCFWCLEGIFSSIRGVMSTKIGYGGGNYDNPTYKSVTHNPGGHTELTIVNYDPDLITLGDLLDVFFEIHNPNKNYIINDKKGELYRSVILYKSDTQKLKIREFISQYESQIGYNISTETLPFRNFNEAEEKYQNYYLSNPEKPFCKNIIGPKVKKLRENKKKNFKKLLV